MKVTKEVFTFTFTTKEDGLVEVLNRLSKMPMFIVVKHLEIEKTSGKLDYTLAPPLTEARGTSDIGGASKVVANPRPPSRMARLVSGREREVPVKVLLTIEVYSF